jgi:hypothetical protein
VFTLLLISMKYRSSSLTCLQPPSTQMDLALQLYGHHILADTQA